MEGSSPPRVWITSEAIRALLQAQREADVEEPCGVLLGRVEAADLRISDVPSTPNSHPMPARAFRIAPQRILEVARSGRERNLTVVGFWHGHLEGPPTPGPADLDGMAAAEALGPNTRVLVVMGRGAGRAPVVRAYMRGRHGTEEVPLRT